MLIYFDTLDIIAWVCAIVGLVLSAYVLGKYGFDIMFQEEEEQ